MRSKSLLLNPWLHLAFLAAVVLFTYSRTLGTYFLADDFGEVAYVARIAGGDMGMLVANFTGNYMQIPSMSVWRPFLLLSLLFDFIVWGAKPYGYYLTNLLYYTGTCLSLYWLIINLTRDWCRTRASLAAIFTALIFALNPLHCESISWVVGRVDIICAFYYLLCLNLFCLSLGAEKQKKRRLTIASVIAFWLAMWTKEMAIGAPVMAFLIALLWTAEPLHFKKALRSAAPLLVSTVIYFILRFMALGTLLGGYTQGIGDAQAAAALSHWLDGDTARRLFLPLAYSIYGDGHIFQTALVLIFTLLSVLLLLRLFSLTLPLRWLLFWPVWLATCLAPIYKLWGLGYELEGARFVFFTTMPLAALFPVMLMAPHSGGSAPKPLAETLFRSSFAALSLTGLASLAWVYGNIAARLNLEWVHAGKEVREFAEQSRALIQAKQAGDVIILGIPKRRGGAHMVLNGTTFQILLSKPFSESTPVADHLLTFDPIIFGEADYINATRFKSALANAGTQIRTWDGEKRKFTSLAPAPAGAALPALEIPAAEPRAFLHTVGHELIKDVEGKPALQHITAGDGIYFEGLDFSPLDADMMEVKFTCLDGPLDRPLAFTCSWGEEGADKHNFVSREFLRGLTDGGEKMEQTLYLRLSNNFHWYNQEKVHSLFLGLPPGTTIVVHSVRLLKAGEITPALSLAAASGEQPRSTARGVTPLASTGDYKVKVSSPPGAKQGKILLEISKANTFFENFSCADQHQAVRQTMQKEWAPTVTFDLPKLPAGANYQVRARLSAGNGAVPGEASDPIVVRVD